ncbi:MAG TPA: hypothetical protein VL918_09775, partial [Sphingobium sp.]|nr:hypothetical protein [Sphingobium sp.]
MLEVKVVRFLALVLPCLFVIASSDDHAFAAPPLSAYGELPGFEMAALSPSGDKVALIGTLGKERKLIVLDKDRKLLTAMAVADAKVRWLQWAGEQTVVLMKSDTAALGIGFTADKAELFSAIVVPLSGGEAWAVFAGKSRVTGGVRGFYGLAERGGKWFGYFGGMTLEGSLPGVAQLMSSDPVLYEVDLQTRAIKQVAPRISEQEDDREWLVGSDGKVAATLDISASRGTWLIRNREGRKIAGGANALGRVDFIGFGPAQDSVIYSDEDVASGVVRWFDLPLAGGEGREILENVVISRGLLDPRSKSLIGYALDG